MLSATSRSSSSARISLQRVMHSLQMYTDGPEMNFRTESLDFPQNEQRRCLSFDIGRRHLQGNGEGLRGSGRRREATSGKVAPRRPGRQVVRAGVTVGGMISVRGVKTRSISP